MKNPIRISTVLLATLFFATNTLAADPFYLGLGGKLSLANWKGDNNGNSASFEDRTTQLGFNLTVQKGRLYGGFNLLGGKYTFSNGSPDHITQDGATVSSNDAIVERGEVDLTIGYYFWSKVSLFLDIKNVGYKWSELNYSQNSTGIGFGVAGFIPLSRQWSLYGSVGIVPLRIETDGTNIGNGDGSALTIGGRFSVTPNSVLTLSLNNQHHEYKFDNGEKQKHDVGSIVFGYNYYFAF